MKTAEGYYETFPIRLEYGKGRAKVTCHFTCVDELKKHIKRCNFKTKDLTITQLNGKEVELVKKRKRKKKC